MAGYTRNDSPNNIADGNIINASDLDGEFDAIQTAFGTGGHTHDGTAGNGPQISTAGIANLAVTGSKIADSTITGGKIDTTTTIQAAGFTGPLTGNASTASKWATTRTISLTGDATGSASIDGSGNISIAVDVSSISGNLALTGQLHLNGSIIKSTQNVVTANTTATTVDMVKSNFHIINMSSNTTFTFSNLATAVASSGTMIIKQDATGGRTFTLPTQCKTPVGGAAIAQSTGPNSVAILSYLVVSSTEVLVNYIGNYA